MKKYYNFRPVLLTGICLLSGTFIARFYPLLRWAVFVVPTLAVFAAAFLYICFYGKNKKKKATITALCLSAVCIIGSAGLLIRVKITENRSLADGQYVLCGEIGEYYTGDYGNSVVLKNCSVNGRNVSDVYVYRYNGEGRLYDKVEVTCYIKSAYKSNNVYYTKLYLSGKGMNAITYSEKIIGKSGSLPSKFLGLCERVFGSGMGDRESRVSVALFTGATYEMESELEWYRLTGLAHIFAVSGLHVGMLYAALSAICFLIGILRLRKFVLISVAVFFYAYLCGGSPSCIRAATMCSFHALASALGKRGDRINSFSAALIVVLLLNPSDLFSVGFMLSFAVSFGLTVTAPQIARVLKFLPDFAAQTLSVLFAAELYSAPVLIINFGSFPLIAIVMNIVFLPVLSLTYYILWIAFFIGTIFPASCAVVCFIPDIILYGFNEIEIVVSKLRVAMTFFPAAIAALYYPSLFISCDLGNFRKETKTAAFSVPVAILAFSVIVSLNL